MLLSTLQCTGGPTTTQYPAPNFGRVKAQGPGVHEMIQVTVSEADFLLVRAHHPLLRLTQKCTFPLQPRTVHQYRECCPRDSVLSRTRENVLDAVEG